MRLSRQARSVLETLENLGTAYGLAIHRAAKGVPKGSVYTVLIRLADQGLVSSKQEDVDHSRPGMPRRFYSMTAEGFAALAAVRASDAAFVESMKIHAQRLAREAAP